MPKTKGIAMINFTAPLLTVATLVATLPANAEDYLPSVVKDGVVFVITPACEQDNSGCITATIMDDDTLAAGFGGEDAARDFLSANKYGPEVTILHRVKKNAQLVFRL